MLSPKYLAPMIHQVCNLPWSLITKLQWKLKTLVIIEAMTLATPQVEMFTLSSDDDTSDLT
jgi:hypothetical protein